MASNGMAKILKGVLKYNKSVKGELLPIFREILDKPSPKSILVTCLDSRIVATRILQAEPGAYFLIRSPGIYIYLGLGLFKFRLLYLQHKVILFQNMNAMIQACQVEQRLHLN